MTVPIPPDSRFRGLRPGRMASRILLAALAAVLFAGAAGADPVRTVRTSREGDYLYVSFSAIDLFDDEAQEELESGLTTRVALRISLRREGSSTPVQASVRTCSVTYDLWDEVFKVHIEDERRSRWVEATTRRDAMRLCTVLRNHRMNVRGLSSGRFVIGVMAELNPVSTAVLEGLRAWLRVPATAGAFGEQGQSFFGSFVAIFINRRIGDSDRVLRFQSEPFDL